MLFLSKEKYELSLEFLRKAEQLCTSSLKSKATTFNNLACFYRKTGKIRTALNYLCLALDIEKKLDDHKAIGNKILLIINRRYPSKFMRRSFSIR